eukprot:Hpha_TRINITY_DN15191_c3_g2::TRINITY_DN15191_c3_g2_i2::g.128344::m.128344
MQSNMRLNLNGQWEPVAPQAWPSAAAPAAAAAAPASPVDPASSSQPSSPQSLQWQTRGAQGTLVCFAQGASGGLDVLVGGERRVVAALSIDRGAEAVACTLQGGGSAALALPEGKERADWIAQALGLLATRVGVPWSVARSAQPVKPQTVSPDAELLEFLSQVGMQTYYAVLRPHTNGTDDLAAWTEAQLETFGVTKVVHRRKLLARIAAMPAEWHEERRVRREKRSAAAEEKAAPAAQTTPQSPPAEPAQPVKWKPDKAATVCDQCWVDFTLLRRRHHCRACGGVFCGSCSEKKMVVGESTTPQRVCDECYHQRKQEKRRERTAFAADLAPAFADLEGARAGGLQKGTTWRVQKEYEAQILNILDSHGGENVDDQVDVLGGINRRDPRFMHTWPLMDPTAQAAA